MKHYSIRSIRTGAIAAILFPLIIATPPADAQNSAQDINVQRVVAQPGPELHCARLEGKIPPCTDAVISVDKVIWAGAYGQSNLCARTPAVPSTVYLIGSTFKAMATVALLQLMEQGKFKLDDKVSDYLTA